MPYEEVGGGGEGRRSHIGRRTFKGVLLQSSMSESFRALLNLYSTKGSVAHIFFSNYKQPYIANYFV
jgi:hypothetical protein